MFGNINVKSIFGTLGAILVATCLGCGGNGLVGTSESGTNSNEVWWCQYSGFVTSSGRASPTFSWGAAARCANENETLQGQTDGEYWTFHNNSNGIDGSGWTKAKSYWLQPDYASNAAFIYSITINDEDDTNAAMNPKTKKLEGAIYYDKDHLSPTAVFQMEVLGSLANMSQKALIFTDDSASLLELLGNKSISTDNFIIVQVDARNYRSTPWARDYAARALYFGGELRGTGYNGVNGYPYNRLLAGLAGVRYSQINDNTFAGGNLLDLSYRGRDYCFIADAKGAYQSIGKQYYCDETTYLQPTAQVDHVDLSMQIVPNKPDEGASGYTIVMARLNSDSGFYSAYQYNASVLNSFVQKRQAEGINIRLVELPVYSYEQLSPTNFILAQNTIIMSLDNNMSDREKSEIRRIMEQTFPDYQIVIKSFTSQFGGGVHCLTGIFTVEMFDHIMENFGNVFTVSYDEFLKFQ